MRMRICCKLGKSEPGQARGPREGCTVALEVALCGDVDVTVDEVDVMIDGWFSM